MSSVAERARQKAEARRLRILSKSADRLGVVSGIVAPSVLKVDGDGGGVAEVATNDNDSPSIITSTTMTDEANDVAQSSSSLRAIKHEEDRDEKSTSSRENDATQLLSSSGVVSTTPVGGATDNSLEALEASRGARRMAAMRRRRYLHSKNKVVAEEEEELEEDVIEKVDANANQLVGGDSTAETAPLVDNSTLNSNHNSESKETEQQLIIGDEPHLANENEDDVNLTLGDEKKEAAGLQDDEDSHLHLNHPKKYMGVARIRRQKVKEQKAQRLKDISDADILGASSSPSRSSGVDLVREISAEVATMDITASMVRKGGVVLADENIGKWWSASSSARAPTKGFLGWNNSKRRSWKWYTSLVLPPMKLVPRLITLLLLFFAGMDLGTQPYRSSSFSDFSSMTGTIGGGSNGGSSLIGYVELSLTKPWEYGMGGKVAYMVGMTATSPPTSLPTHFLAASSEDEDDEGSDIMEYVAPNEAECAAALTNGEDKKKIKSEIAIKKKTNSIQLQLMEDEFDSTRTRPRGVVNHHHGLDSEFDDNEYDPTASINNNNNIDPLFQVDLDALLRDAHLPLPIDYAAKFAIGFHRTWVHYLWKLPTSLVRWIIGIPINMMSGWIANPPWILGVVLLIRFITKVLVGSTSSSGKSFSPSENDDAAGDSGMLGGGGGGNFDVLEKIIGAAKNYASSSFPKTSFVFGTLMQVMKVDMYVLLCGLMIGLVMCSIDEVSSTWMDGSDRGEAHSELGNGEL